MLSKEHHASYMKNGYLSGIDVLSDEDTAKWRDAVETIEAEHPDGAGGHSLQQYFRVNGQIVIPFLARAAMHPAILDAVSTVLGPNILVWSVELFIKEPGTTAIVSWHQDLTYWGMGETDEEVTAWLALSDVSVAAGCMRFIPGSHQGRIVAHHDTFDPQNLLSRGQEIAGINEDDAVHAPLKPGQMSLHHGRTFHASGPNQSPDRRIGLAIRYVTPEVKQADQGRDYAMLVRGVDRAKGWISIAPPQVLFGAAECALYDEVLAHQSQTLGAGAAQTVGLYAPKTEGT